MHIRTPGRARALLVCLLLPAFALSACRGGDEPEEEFESPYGAVVLNPRDKPDLALPDTGGERYDLRTQTEGKLTLVYLGYTFCPDICPLEMAELSAGLALLEPDVRDRIAVIFITVDPERDTPAVLRRWLDSFDPEFVGLVPEPDQVDAVANAFGISAPERTEIGSGFYTVSHAAYVSGFLTDNQLRYIFPAGFTPDMWQHDLELLVTREEDFLP